MPAQPPEASASTSYARFLTQLVYTKRKQKSTTAEKPQKGRRKMVLIVILSCVFLCVIFGAFVAVIIFYDDDLQSRKVTRGRGKREKMPVSPSRRRAR